MRQRILVVGLGKSGRALVEVLMEEGHEVAVYDSKPIQAFEKDILKILGVQEGYFAVLPEPMDFDYLAMSPGVSLEEPIVREAMIRAIPLKGEIEVAYERARGEFVGITGTNGKTTTTTLTYEIFRAHFDKVSLAGNIGLPAVTQVSRAPEGTLFITEISSFQLETIQKFRPSLAGILNITPDHLNRHGDMASYIQAKLRIFENCGASDARVLNYDDEILRDYGKRFPGTFFFSRAATLQRGCFVTKEGTICCSRGGNPEPVMDVEQIPLLESHNLENVLAAVSFGFLYGIPPEVMAKTVRDFKGVEHRLEVFATRKGITFINDSKATNPEASIKALEAMEGPTVLIAGGMDKGSDFTPMIEKFSPWVKHLCLFGETKEIFREDAESMGYRKISLHQNLEEALAKALEIAEEGDRVLLSPACASWDMYENFEVRGKHFKKLVDELG